MEGETPTVMTQLCIVENPTLLSSNTFTTMNSLQAQKKISKTFFRVLQNHVLGNTFHYLF